ncbi:hypothetical protein ABFS83_04G047200 [Erythranthe nasuta]
MENSSPLILEISSDEESDFGCVRKGVDGGGGGEYGDKEDCNWLSKLLDEVGGKNDDDSDDVVFVSEVLPRNPKKLKLAKVVDDDDDCVVLDGDPDKQMVVFNAKEDNNDDSDDLEIVGEKGEVACRDFPHPRHHCAIYPFASTPHGVHCGQCHCHVCDSLAPCSHWGNGISSIDHCHANDKDEYWRAERKRMRKVDKAVPTIPSKYGTIQAFFQRSQVRAVAPPQPNYLPQNKALNPVTLRPCSISSSVSVPNTVNPGVVRLSGRIAPRTLAPPQLHRTCNNKVPSSGSRSAQSFPPHAVFKRSGPAGVSPNNMQAYRSQLSRDKTVRSSQTPLLNVRHRSNPQRVLGPAAHSVPHQPNLSSSPHNVDVGCENNLPSQSHIQSVPFSNSLIRDPIRGQSQVPSQPYLRSNFASAVPSQTNVASQPSEENFQSLILPQLDLYQPSIPVLSQTAPSYQSDAVNHFHDQLNTSLVSSHMHVDNSFGNQSSQPDAHSNNSTPLFTDGQNAFQQGNHVQNSIAESPTDFGFALDSSIGHGNMQIHAEVSPCQSEEPAYDSQHQSIAINNDHHQSIAAVVNFHQENVVTADNSSLINDNENRFPGSIGPDLLDFQFDNWMFENHSLPAVFEVPLSPVWNVFSPEPSSIDTDWKVNRSLHDSR